MSRSIWQINKDVEVTIANHIDDNGELDPGVDARLELLGMEKSAKLESIIGSIKTFQSRIDAHVRAKSWQNESIDYYKKIVEGLKTLIVQNVEPGETFESINGRISWRQSEAVEISDDCGIDEQWYRKITNWTPDLVAIKEAIKSGEVVPGATLVKRNNLQIK